MILLTINLCCGYSERNVYLPRSSMNEIHSLLEHTYHISKNSYYITSEGKLITSDHEIINDGHLLVFPKLLGGKGGFGSMLRAIGAQIEKTTNREACRDLSGRRLRDINEEQRLKSWISQQAEREREIEERKKKKLEKLSSEPRHEFKDEEYEVARSVLSEQLSDAVEQGFLASQGSSKRPAEDTNTKRKKKKFLICSDEELSTSDEECNSDDNDQLSGVHSKIHVKVESDVEKPSGINKNVLEPSNRDIVEQLNENELENKKVKA